MTKGGGQRKCEWVRSRDKDTEGESLLPFPGSQVFISLFVNAGFITQSSTGARLSCGCIKVRLIRQPIGGKTEEGNTNYVMYPLCCSFPSILAISHPSPVLLPPSLPQPAHPPSPSLGPQGGELFRPSPTASDGD